MELFSSGVILLSQRKNEKTDENFDLYLYLNLYRTLRLGLSLSFVLHVYCCVFTAHSQRVTMLS
jgi:hypothetical protein